MIFSDLFWSLRRRTLSFKQTPIWMGIVNLTPDSFSDGGRFQREIETVRFLVDVPKAIDYALDLVEQGTGIIDVGGESSRPGSEPVSETEEIHRVIPVVQRLVKKTAVPISVDTTRASVARLAILAGAEIINDVSGGTFDPEMLDVLRRYQPGYCLTHIQGRPKTMQDAPNYQNVVEEVFQWLKNRLNYFIDAGIPKEKICLDIGIGFGKTFEQNIELLRNVDYFHSLGRPLLIGHSRKRFLNPFLLQNNRRFSRRVPDSQETSWPLNQIQCEAIRDDWTAIVSLILAQKGVQILRVHNVQKNRTAIDLDRMLQRQIKE